MNRKTLFRLARKFCTAKETEPFVVDKKPQKIKFHPSELFPFKFRHEQYSLYSGFTEEELFGIKHGLKHSPQILREIKKDNIIFMLLLVGIYLYMVGSREVSFKIHESFGKYIGYDMNVKRGQSENK